MSDKADVGINDEDDARIIALRESIRNAFPVKTFEGEITPYDGAWTPELGDERTLYDSLKERKWIDVPRQLIYDLPDGYVLLTDQAFAAFLPAWLMSSLENIHTENEVRDFLIFSFGNTARQLCNLNRKQQRVVRSMLSEFIERVTVPSVHTLAVQAVEYIDIIDKTYPSKSCSE